MNTETEVIQVPKPSGKISFGAFAEDLARAFRDAGPRGDPWREVARVALKFAPIVLPEGK